jgi:hypothetical protein
MGNHELIHGKLNIFGNFNKINKGKGKAVPVQAVKAH